MIALRGRLSLASSVATGFTFNGETYDVYLDPSIGYYTIANDTDKGIVIQLLDIDMKKKAGGQYPLLQQYPLLEREQGFISSYGDSPDEIIPYASDKNLFTIRNLQVRKKGEAEPLAKLDDDYIIHTVNP